MSTAPIKRKLPIRDVAAFQMEAIAGELSLVSGIPGLHFVTREGVRMFPCFGEGGKVEKYTAFMVAGDESSLPSDVPTSGEAFTFGATHGIAITFQPMPDDSGLVSQCDNVCKSIANAIKVLKQHIAEAPHA